MRQLSLLILRYFVPIFFGALTFFIVLINGADLFANIVPYAELSVPFSQIMRVQLLYLPNCVVFALPIALLFAVSFSMGSLYSNNELIIAFASGVSLNRFILPLIVVGIVLSLGLFAFNDLLAIPMLREKQKLSLDLLHNRPQNLNQANISIQAEAGRVIYDAAYYDDGQQRLNDVTLIVRNENNGIRHIVYAQWAQWDEDGWEFHRLTHVHREIGNSEAFSIDERESLRLAEATLPPINFQNRFQDIDEMQLAEAGRYVSYLRSGGFPYRQALTRYHERFSFAFTPLVVVLLSAGVGGRFKKNILAMSLLVSLGLSIVYYSIQMLSGLFASLGIINSIFGAWAGSAITTAGAVYILRKAKT